MAQPFARVLKYTGVPATLHIGDYCILEVGSYCPSSSFSSRTWRIKDMRTMAQLINNCFERWERGDSSVSPNQSKNNMPTFMADEQFPPRETWQKLAIRRPKVPRPRKVFPKGPSTKAPEVKTRGKRK